MDLAAVTNQVSTALGVIPGLRISPYELDRINPPQAVVGWPTEMTYDATMGRGSDRMELELFIFVSRADMRSARTQLAAYLAGSGVSSVKAAVERGTYTACDSLRVKSVAIDGYIVGGQDYLGARFAVDVIGRGA